MEPDAPAPSRTPLYLTLGAGALFAGALTYIGAADPHRPGFLAPACPFLHLTGWLCPGCGGLRMTHDLLHGDVAGAVADNVFLLVGIPLLILWVVLRRRQHRTVLPIAAIVVIAVATVTWTVVRNLPGFPLVPTLLDG
jgi:Na+/H+ antiporter NhaD/arsenite permease-like protein